MLQELGLDGKGRSRNNENRLALARRMMFIFGNYIQSFAG